MRVESTGVPKLELAGAWEPVEVWHAQTNSDGRGERCITSRHAGRAPGTCHLAVVLMYDGGESAYSAMRKAAGKLITGTLIKVVTLADGAQPDDLSGDELACLLPS